jgi:hypothetical protein
MMTDYGAGYIAGHSWSSLVMSLVMSLIMSLVMSLVISLVISLIISLRQCIADYIADYVADDIADDDVSEKRKRDEPESLNARSNKRTDESGSMFIEKRLAKRRQQDLRIVRLESKKERSRDNDTFSVNPRKFEFEYSTNPQTQRARELRNER